MRWKFFVRYSPFRTDIWRPADNLARNDIWSPGLLVGAPQWR